MTSLNQCTHLSRKFAAERFYLHTYIFIYIDSPILLYSFLFVVCAMCIMTSTVSWCFLTCLVCSTLLLFYFVQYHYTRAYTDKVPDDVYSLYDHMVSIYCIHHTHTYARAQWLAHSLFVMMLMMLMISTPFCIQLA